MNFEVLADTLNNMYTKGKGRRESIASLTLFGIRYASEIRAVEAPSVAATVENLLRNAQISPHHETHIRVGMQLAAYVAMRTP